MAMHANWQHAGVQLATVAISTVTNAQSWALLAREIVPTSHGLIRLGCMN